MTWDITAAGTITIDDVTTPHGRRSDQPGGSALYFTLAARRFAPTHVVGVVGRDWERSVRAILTGVNVDLAGMEVSEDPTFRERTIHDFQRWVAFSPVVEMNAYTSWHPRLLPTAAQSPVLFLGSMPPESQLEVVRQSGASLIAVDTMSIFIESNRAAVMTLVREADFVFLNEDELTRLVNRSRLDSIDAARLLLTPESLSPRAIVVKRGPAGIICVTRTEVIEKPAHPVARVIDPTGAGDALAGGFLGTCARLESTDEARLAQGLDEGLRCAADAIQSFGVTGLINRLD